MKKSDYKLGKELMEAIGEDMIKGGTINMDVIITLARDSVYTNLGVYISYKDAEKSIMNGMVRGMRN
jgi:hypothetical protein